MKLFIVAYTTQSNGFIEASKTKTFNDESSVLSYAMSFTDRFRKVSKIFSVDHHGTKITHYDIIFDGHLKLVEKEQ